MTVLVLAVVIGGFLAWRRHRVGVKDTRAGLLSERPVFSVEPPTRRLGSRGRERL